MIVLRQAKKQEWNLFLRQKGVSGKVFPLGKKTPESYNTKDFCLLLLTYSFVSLLLKAQN